MSRSKRVFPAERPPAGDLRPLEPVEEFVLGFRGVRQAEDESEVPPLLDVQVGAGTVVREIAADGVAGIRRDLQPPLRSRPPRGTGPMTGGAPPQ